MPGTPYTLWCLVKRDKAPFSVPVPSNILISDLKIIIQERIKTDTPAHKLELWKVNVDFDVIMGAINTGQYHFETNPQQQLWAAHKVSQVWPQPPSDDPSQLHVYVVVPPPVDTTAPKHVDYHWLEALRSKLWNKKQLKQDLFREVEVTEAHFNELQELLNAQHPDRGSRGYGGDHNVLSVKLDFLRSIPKNEDGSKMDVDGPEASDGRRPSSAIPPNRPIFPFTLRFLDLSVLSLKKVPKRLPSPLFLRQEYDDITALIENGPQTKDSVVVSGQPGTGKTAYLLLRVVQFMIEGRSFLYQAQNKTVYHVNEEGVKVITSWPQNEDIVAFVDGDEAGYEPDHMLREDGVQIILASSPKGATARWIQQTTGHIEIIVTNLWSLQELFVTGAFLYPLDISPTLLRESTLYFGCNPRRCFTSARSVKVLHATRERVRSKITCIDYRSDMMQLLYASRTGDSAVSHSIFEILPIDESRQLAECGFDIVSHWVLRLFMEEYESCEAHRANDFYRQISGLPKAASLWGHVFEQKVLHHIDTYGCEFEIRALASPGMITWECPGPIRRYTFQREEDFILEITETIKKNKSLHLVHLASNFEAVDSILYSPNDVLTCIQTTVSGNHPISVGGLQRLQNWLGTEPPLADLRPSRDRPWRFIFVVPPGDASTYEKQQFKTDTKSDAWDGRVHQHVLGLDVLGKKTG